MNMGQSRAKLSIFFIVEPGKYETMGCYLAASIRENFKEPIDLIGYCPTSSIDRMNPRARAIFDRLDVAVRPIETADKWREPYPHGNKIIAAMEPRDTPWSAFLDSDMAFISANTSDAMTREGHVSVAPATSMYWAGQNIWKTIYGVCDMPLPSERIWLQRQKRRKLMPYFNAGLVAFEEGPMFEGESFAEIWYRLARRIDDQADVPKKRPYLDQMSLPLAIQAAKKSWHLLPPEQHYILGGSMRGEPLPPEHDIKMIHYRSFDILREVGHIKTVKNALETHTGVRRIDKFRTADDAE